MTTERWTAIGLVASALCVLTALASVGAAGDQVTGLTARHHAGQTFLVWREADPPSIKEGATVAELIELNRGRIDETRYRIYRDSKPISTLNGLEPIGEAAALSCWNTDFYGMARTKQPAFRYVVEEGSPALPVGSGLYVHNPQTASNAWYAVTVVKGGRENRATSTENALQKPVAETVGQGDAVLQRVEETEKWNFVRNPTLHYYTRWESPPNANVENRPLDYVVAVPPNPAKPAPVGLHLHAWNASLDRGYGWWYQAEQGHLLLASNQIPYDWWTGYHEFYGLKDRTKGSWQEGVVRPYTQTRIFSMLDWVATKWDVDLTRTHVAGNSMGGSGAVMTAIRHPDEVAWAVGWVGVHVPHLSPRFAKSYSRAYGEKEWGIQFEDGTPVWDFYNDAWYLRAHPRAEVGLICFSNGKNDNAIGWEQAVEFHRALQETRRPHIFVWGQGGHGQRAKLPISLRDRQMPMDLRIDQSQPAFTRCSLDDDPGNGDPQHGDAKGQSNLYLFWETRNVVDTAERWEMTVGLVRQAPNDACTVDVTPRRLQQLTPKPGQQFVWTNTSLASGELLQTGEVTADGDGLLTLPKVKVGKGLNRIRIVTD